MINTITNSIHKEVKLLHKRKNRDEKNLFFIEGIRFVKDAILGNVDIKYIVVSENLIKDSEIDKLLKNTNAKIYVATEKIIKDLSDTDTPQGIIAVLPYLDFDKQMDDKKSKTFLILDAIQDPGNMGTIIRTADATGTDKIILSKGCVDIYNPKVLRATMGSIFRTNVMMVENLVDYIKMLKKEGFMVLAAHLDATESYFDIDLKGNVAVVIGNEANGIRKEVSDVCSKYIKIPMIGNIESLNAGVSASVILYEVLRQKIYSFDK